MKGELFLAFGCVLFALAAAGAHIASVFNKKDKDTEVKLTEYEWSFH